MLATPDIIIMCVIRRRLEGYIAFSDIEFAQEDIALDVVKSGINSTLMVKVACFGSRRALGNKCVPWRLKLNLKQLPHRAMSTLYRRAVVIRLLSQALAKKCLKLFNDDEVLRVLLVLLIKYEVWASLI